MWIKDAYNAPSSGSKSQLSYIVLPRALLLFTSRVWTSFPHRTVKTFSFTTHLFRGIILNIRKSLRWGTSISIKLSKWDYVAVLLQLLKICPNLRIFPPAQSVFTKKCFFPSLDAKSITITMKRIKIIGRIKFLILNFYLRFKLFFEGVQHFFC